MEALLDLDDLKRACRKSVHLAGARYTPGMDSNAPGIAIDHLKDVADALGLAAGFRARLDRVLAELSEALERSKYSVRPQGLVGFESHASADSGSIGTSERPGSEFAVEKVTRSTAEDSGSSSADEKQSA